MHPRKWERSGQPCVMLECANNLGESILWDDRSERLYWVNTHERQIWSWSPWSGGAPRILELEKRIGAIGLRESGGLVAGLESGFALIDLQTGQTRKISSVEDELPTTRLNDGRVDPAGRFVCGGMDEADPQRGISALYCCRADHSVSRLMSGITCTNSLCWSPDGAILYFTDMPARRIEALDYDLISGRVANRRLFADLSGEPGWADGSIVDAEGFLWNAQWQGAKIVRYAPDGSVDREYVLPVSNPTCLAFGGPDYETLFVTTAKFGLSGEQLLGEPFAGHLFAFRPGVRGRPETRFAG